MGFCVKMVNSAHLHAASGYTEGRILNGLKFKDGRGAGVREPDGGGVGEKGADEGFVSDEECFLVLAPAGASKGLEEV